MMIATAEIAPTFADDVSRLTAGLGTRVERFADQGCVSISWPPLVRIATLARLTGLDQEMFIRSPLKGRIYLDMPVEIADAEFPQRGER